MDAQEVRLLLEGLRDLGNDHSTVEVKKARGGLPTRLWETISSFANARGGVLLLGISEADDFAVTGVDDPAAMERQLGQVCSDSMTPPVRAVISTVQIDNRSVVIAEVPALDRTRRPCFYSGAGPYGGSYIRVADGDRKLTDYEVGLLLSERGQPRDDERPVSTARLDDLDSDLLDGYLRLLRRDKPRLFTLGGNERVLQLTKVLVPDEESGRLVPSIAGILALGSFPQAFLPQVDLTFVSYPTSTRGAPGPGNERFLDNASIDGSIPLITDDTMSRLRQRMSRRSIISGVARRDVYEYPEEAVREALVNALAHRDLSAASLGTQVQVEMFPDRLEVKNPGGLHGPVSVEELVTASTSSARNAALYKILEHVPLPDRSGTVCENRGSGIKAMIASLRSAGMSLPRFIDEVASFQVVFPNASLLDQETLDWLAGLGQSGLTDSQVLALARMRHGEVLKNATYRAETGVDSRVATAELRDLVERQVVQVTGVRGGATYRVEQKKPQRSTSDGPVAASVISQPQIPKIAVDTWRALEGDGLTRAELEQRLGLPAHAVSYRLRALREAGLAEPIGQNRSPHTRWRRLW